MWEMEPGGREEGTGSDSFEEVSRLCLLSVSPQGLLASYTDMNSLYCTLTNMRLSFITGPSNERANLGLKPLNPGAQISLVSFQFLWYVVTVTRV